MRQQQRSPRRAHEYIGEAYRLIACEEYEDLKKAVADYRARAAK